MAVTAWHGFEGCEVHPGWREGGDGLGDQLVMSAMGAVTYGHVHIFNAGPVLTAHRLTISPLLMTQTGDNPIRVRGATGAPTGVAEFP